MFTHGVGRCQHLARSKLIGYQNYRPQPPGCSPKKFPSPSSYPGVCSSGHMNLKRGLALSAITDVFSLPNTTRTAAPPFGSILVLLT
jgi:hypothetical protein